MSLTSSVYWFYSYEHVRHYFAEQNLKENKLKGKFVQLNATCNLKNLKPSRTYVMHELRLNRLYDFISND